MTFKAKHGKVFGLLTVLHRDWTRPQRVHWLCKCTCGNETSVRSDHLGKDIVSCGCYNRELIRKSQEGNRSSTFKNTGGRLLFYTVVRPLYTEIKNRDNNSCVLCGKTTDLHVHHILRKSKYPDLIFEPNNLVTLCSDCHFFDAHSGNTNNINLELSEELLHIVFDNSLDHPIDEEVIKQIDDKFQKIKQRNKL